MWFRPPRQTPDWSAGTRYLCAASPLFAPLVKHAGPCTLTPRRDYFIALCQAITGQQVSMIVAEIIFKRFCGLFPRRRPVPQLAAKLSDEALRSAGLSRGKSVYIRDLARHFADGLVPTRRFRAMGDEEIIEALLPVKGIGRWTAEMFLIFVLNRPDVLPVDDLGLRKGVQRALGLSHEPSRQRIIKLAEPWRPWRTVATWYLWRGAAGG